MMRFLGGILAAMLMVGALLIYTAPDVRPPPSDGPRTTASTANVVRPAATERVGNVSFKPDGDWQTMSRRELAKEPDFGTFAEVVGKARNSLTLIKQTDDGELSGLLMVLDIGRTSTQPAAAIQRVVDKHAKIGNATRLIWGPREERLGELATVSAGVKMAFRGQIGKRMMEAGYYATRADGRSFLIIGLSTNGSSAERELKRMLASLKES